MTTKEAFTDEEWTRICRAPFVAGMAITIADPGGPIEISKEGMATIKAATVPPSREELLTAVALDIEAMIQSKHNPAKDFKPKAAPTAGACIAVRYKQRVVPVRCQFNQIGRGRWHEYDPKDRRSMTADEGMGERPWEEAPCIARRRNPRSPPELSVVRSLDGARWRDPARLRS